MSNPGYLLVGSLAAGVRVLVEYLQPLPTNSSTYYMLMGCCTAVAPMHYLGSSALKDFRVIRGM